MGLREKVALALAAVLTAQIVCSYSMPRSPPKISSKSHVSSLTTSKIKTARDNKSNKRIKINPLNNMRTTDSHKGDYSRLSPDCCSIPVKYKETKKTSKLSSSIRDYGEARKRRNNKIISNVRTNPAFMTTNVESNQIRQPYCFRTSSFFPEVEYPLSARDTWIPKYWSRLQDAERDQNTRIDICQEPTKITKSGNLEDYRSSLSNIIKTLNEKTKVITETDITEVTSEAYVTKDEGIVITSKISPNNSVTPTKSALKSYPQILMSTNPIEPERPDLVTLIDNTTQITSPARLPIISTSKKYVSDDDHTTLQKADVPMPQDYLSETLTSDLISTPSENDEPSKTTASTPSTNLSEKTTIPVPHDETPDIVTSPRIFTLSEKSTLPISTLSEKTNMPVSQDDSSGITNSVPISMLSEKVTVSQDDFSETTASMPLSTLSEKITEPVSTDGFSESTSSAPISTPSEKVTVPVLQHYVSGITTSPPIFTQSEKVTVPVLQDVSSKDTQLTSLSTTATPLHFEYELPNSSTNSLVTTISPIFSSNSQTCTTSTFKTKFIEKPDISVTNDFNLSSSNSDLTKNTYTSLTSPSIPPSNSEHSKLKTAKTLADKRVTIIKKGLDNCMKSTTLHSAENMSCINSPPDIQHNKKIISFCGLTQTHKPLQLGSTPTTSSLGIVNSPQNSDYDDVLLIYVNDSSKLSSLSLEHLNETLLINANNSYKTWESIPEHPNDFIILVDCQDPELSSEILIMPTTLDNSHTGDPTVLTEKIQSHTQSETVGSRSPEMLQRNTSVSDTTNRNIGAEVDYNIKSEFLASSDDTLESGSGSHFSDMYDILAVNPDFSIASVSTVPEYEDDSWLIFYDTENTTTGTYVSANEISPIFNSVMQEINSNPKSFLEDKNDVYDVILYTDDNSTIQYDYFDDVSSSCTETPYDSWILYPEYINDAGSKYTNDSCVMIYQPTTEDSNEDLIFIDANKYTGPNDEIIVEI